MHAEIDPLVMAVIQGGATSATQSGQSFNPSTPGQFAASAFCERRCQGPASAPMDPIDETRGASGEVGTRTTFSVGNESETAAPTGNPNSLVLRLSAENPELAEKLLNDPVFWGKLQANPDLMERFLADLGLGQEEESEGSGRGAAFGGYGSAPACYANCIREFQIGQAPPSQGQGQDNFLQLLLLQQAFAPQQEPVELNVGIIPQNQLSDFSDFEGDIGQEGF